jgi:hypothetical protein
MSFSIVYGLLISRCLGHGYVMYEFLFEFYENKVYHSIYDLRTLKLSQRIHNSDFIQYFEQKHKLLKSFDFLAP